MHAIADRVGRSVTGAGWSASSRDAPVYAGLADAAAFARRLLTAHGVPGRDAAVVADCLLRADLRGVDTHGLVRLPTYLDRLRRGLVEPAPDLAVTRVTPVAGALDGRNGLGAVVATLAMAEAVAMAGESGVGVVSARRSTHFGMASCYALQAVEAGFVAWVFTNASRAMAPWGGREPLLGTSPLAAGAPGGRLGPFVLDMSTSVAARGKIRRAASRGEAIPPTYALDAQGRPTTDPAAALQGVLLPVGGPKGSGLSLLMEVVCGVLSGAAFGGDVGDAYRDFDRPQNVGHFFLAMRPDLFVPEDAYRDRMDTLLGRVKDCPPADGVEEVLLPGEPEARSEARRRAGGVPYSPATVAALNAEATRAGLPALPVSPVPLDG